MPPPIPEHFKLAKKRMRQGLHPAVIAAAARAAGAPSPGAGTQVYAGTGVNTRGTRPPAGGDARSAVNPLANQRYKRYLQRDPEGGIRELHVYGTGQNRQVKAFNRLGPVAPSLMQQLSNTATADDKLLAIAARRAAAGNLAHDPRKKRVFNYRGGGFSRDV